MQALAINEFANSPLRFNIDLNIQSSSLPPLTVKGESVLRELAFQKARFPWDVFGLMSIAVVSAAVTYILLIVGDMRKGGLWGLLASHASKARCAFVALCFHLPSRESPANPQRRLEWLTTVLTDPFG